MDKAEDTQAFVGLMSGTSLDGVDGVVADIATDGTWQGVRAHAHEPFDAALREELLALNRSGPDELHRAALAAQGVSRAYARVVARLRQAAPDQPIRALGAHGQTVRHRPELGYTVQLLAPALLAELTTVDVVADLRSRDLAAGGQGAPLVPVFHQAVFGHPDRAVAALNIGGIANVSVLNPGQPPRGFDCGPGNVLMDLWCQRHAGQPYDKDGQWAASGRIHEDWLALALADPYFALPPPKSTGRDLFHAQWLEGWLQRCQALTGGDTASPTALADVQATLCELTARSSADAVRGQAPQASELIVCGGGAFNGQLMRRLQALLPGVAVASSATRGLPPEQVEAAAFAWLAWAAVNRCPGNDPAVTGAAGPRILGAIYPA
ncbi:MAG: anhydro-N-acetylmuramic acid kinase [Pseudomonadota bacterium]